jgi:hypothetical protein
MPRLGPLPVFSGFSLAETAKMAEKVKLLAGCTYLGGFRSLINAEQKIGGKEAV